MLVVFIYSQWLFLYIPTVLLAGKALITLLSNPWQGITETTKQERIHDHCFIFKPVLLLHPIIWYCFYFLYCILQCPNIEDPTVSLYCNELEMPSPHHTTLALIMNEAGL